MKKKFWIAVLTAVLVLNLLPGMTPEAAADDTPSLGTIVYACAQCHKMVDLKIIEYISRRDGYQNNEEQHWLRVQCPSCGEEYCFLGEDHTGGTETPTCTTGKTCDKCGGEYGKLGHDWGEWQSSGDNKTHKRICKRDGCSEVDTADCGGDSSATCVTPGTCTACGEQYYGGHYFASPYTYGYDENSHWHACCYCDEGKEAVDAHFFVSGNMYVASPATCVSKVVYYKNCAYCRYKGTATYEYEWSNIDPNNHTGNEEIRGAVEATCTQDGYTGDTYCKDCDALLSSGTVIPATGHTGGTEVRGAADATCTQDGYTGDTYCKDCDALLSSGTVIPAAGHTGGTPTCLRRAKCGVCGERYGDIDRSNHVDGCEPEWTVTETEHTQKYSRCGKLLTEAGAHTFGDWAVTQEPTESEEGGQERVCTLCGYTETEAIPVAEVKASPSPAPAATPEPTAEPTAEPDEPSSAGSAWWIIALIVAAGVGTGIAVRQKKKK